jgi:hypothetical protein
MQSYIKSPKSGKFITVKSAPRVKREKPGSKSTLSHEKKVVQSNVRLPKAKLQNLSDTLATIPQSRKSQRANTVKMIGRGSEKRGSKTRGWGAAAPQRGTERHQLKKKCGSDCFLMPGKEAFPICASLRTGQGCKVDCRGIIAAKVRAGEWKYEHVKRAAQLLEKKYGC